MLDPEIRATAGGDWVVGVGASYVPCPRNCGRMVADTIHGESFTAQPCTRCVKIAAQKAVSSAA